MQKTLLVSICLVMGVVFVFLGRLVPMIAAGITIPLSFAGTFFGMWLAGFSVDNLSLMALAISVGFVVDDAIVVIENVVHKLEDGMPPLQAAIDGAGAHRVHGGDHQPVAGGGLPAPHVHGRHDRQLPAGVLADGHLCDRRLDRRGLDRDADAVRSVPEAHAAGARAALADGALHDGDDLRLRGLSEGGLAARLADAAGAGADRRVHGAAVLGPAQEATFRRTTPACCSGRPRRRPTSPSRRCAGCRRRRPTSSAPTPRSPTSARSSAAPAGSPR